MKPTDTTEVMPIKASPVAVDDVVVVHTKDQPRAFWKLGRIEEVLVGRDGEVRGAKVRVAGQGRRATTLHRPIQLLYPLEVSAQRKGRTGEETGPQTDETQPGAPEDVVNQSHVQPDPQPMRDQASDVPVRRSRRAAAQEARDKLLTQFLSDQ